MLFLTERRDRRCHRNVWQHKEMVVLDHRASHFSSLTVYKSRRPAEGCRKRLGEQRDRGRRHTIHFCLLGFCRVQTPSWFCVISRWLPGSSGVRLTLQSVLSLQEVTVKEWDLAETWFLGYSKKYLEEEEEEAAAHIRYSTEKFFPLHVPACLEAGVRA